MFYCGTSGRDYYPDRMEVIKGTDVRHTIRIVTPPATEPLTVAEAKAQLNIAASDDSHDVELASKIAAARQEWERDTSKALITRTVEHRLPMWLDVIRLSVQPVIAISSIIYVDNNGDEQTLDAANYYLDIDELRFKTSFNKPALEDRSEAVRITYTAGYGAASTDVPEIDKLAIKLSVANRFEDLDMINGGAGERKAYENLVRKHMRSSYP